MVFWDKLLAVDSLDQLSELLTRTWRVSDKSSSCFHWLPWDQKHLLQKADKGLGQRFSLGVVLPPRRHLAIAGIFRSPDLGWGCCWHLVGGGQGYFPTLHSAEDDLPHGGHPAPGDCSAEAGKPCEERFQRNSVITDHTSPNSPSCVSTALVKLAQD